MISLNPAPLPTMMDWSAWKICHANVHLMSNICLKFQVNIFKTVEVVHIRRFCEIVLPCKKKWSDPHGNMSSTSSFHAEQMYKVWSHCFENCRSSSCHNILIYSAPFKKRMDWSIWKIFCPHRHLMITVSSQYLENVLVRIQDFVKSFPSKK